LEYQDGSPANQENGLLDLLGLNQCGLGIHRAVAQSVAVWACQSSICTRF
jgi:hypothetical protein